ncbi:MAG TPA: family 16 glycosylhydrolase [Bacteroidia bacterium]|jgi:hypothetical protein
MNLKPNSSMIIKLKNKLLLLFFLCFSISYAQQTNYGYSSRQLLYTAHTPVTAASNLIFFGPHIFYVGTNNKICEYYWNNITWTGGGQLEWGAVTVKTGSKITSNGNGEVYFVGNADNKIYKLSWGPTTGWVTSLMVSIQEPVRSDANIVFYNNHIYYVGTSNRICDINYTGTAWVGGTALVSLPALYVRATAQIIANGSYVFYVGTNNRVCSCFWTGTAWTGGGQLESGINVVKTGSQIINNGGEIFFVGNADSKVYDLKYTSGWIASIALSTAPTVKTGTDLVYYHENIYYVSNSAPSTNKAVNIKRAGAIWSLGYLPDYSSEDVMFSTPITVTSKNIFKEGSATNTFESVQVSYVGSPSNRIRYLINDYDNKNDPNETGSTIWFGGGLKTTANTVNTNKLIVCPDSKTFFYIGFNGYLNTFLRNAINPIDKPGWISTFDQEFNTADPTLTTLKTNWNYKNGPLMSATYNPNEPKISYDTYFENTTIDNGILKLTNKQENYSAWQWGMYDIDPSSATNWTAYNHDGYPWQPGDWQFFDYSSVNYTGVNIQTGSQNLPPGPSGTETFPPPAPPYEPATFSQAYGYYEIRCKTPRSQKNWNAFWLLSTITNPPEIDILEISGNGKYWVMSNYWGPYGSGQSTNIKEYAVGYRYYDDYYTYALEWDATKLRWLLNNEPVLTLSTNVPSDPVAIIAGTATYNNVDLNEITTFPHYFDIDYIRAYADDPTRIAVSVSPILENKSYILSPNPAQDQITIGGGAFTKAEIYNIQGAKISENVSGTINIESLSKGIYIIKIIDLNGESHNSKFIKE